MLEFIWNARNFSFEPTPRPLFVIARAGLFLIKTTAVIFVLSQNEMKNPDLVKRDGIQSDVVSGSSSSGSDNAGDVAREVAQQVFKLHLLDRGYIDVGQYHKDCKFHLDIRLKHQTLECEAIRRRDALRRKSRKVCLRACVHVRDDACSGYRGIIKRSIEMDMECRIAKIKKRDCSIVLKRADITRI